MYLAICDGDPDSLAPLLRLLEHWQQSRRTALRLAVFSEAEALLKAAQQEPFHLCLLDPLLPGSDGLAAAQTLRSLNPGLNLAFLSSSPSYACASYRLHARAYLLKPADPARLFALLDRVFFETLQPQEGLILHSGGELIRIPFAQLVFVEVRNRHLFFHLADGQVYAVAGTLRDYQSVLLSQPEFFRIHRSYLVNLRQLERFSSAGAVTRSGQNLPVSRTFYPLLRQRCQDLYSAAESQNELL